MQDNTLLFVPALHITKLSTKCAGFCISQYNLSDPSEDVGDYTLYKYWSLKFVYVLCWINVMLNIIYWIKLKGETNAFE